MRVLRVSHSAVVDAWRERERSLRRAGVNVHLLSARVWNEGGRPVSLRPRDGEAVQGVATFGTHPALFLYDPRPIWRALGETWDLIDIHEEPFALATTEILLLRALRRVRTPYLVYSAQNLEKRLPAPFAWMQRRVLNRARAVSVCNTAAGEIVQRRGFPGVADVIPLGIDHRGRTVTARKAHTPPVVGYAGRLDPHKGVGALLDAVADLPESRLVVAGDGALAGALRRRAARSDLAGRVSFLGPVEGDALDDFYAGLDVLAVPSLTTPTWAEQFGRVAVEAMSHGVPVVASDSGALPDVVGGAGLLVPPGDVTALAEALSQVLDDAELAQRLRENGRERAAACDWSVVAQLYQEMYRRVLHRDPPTTSGVEVIVVAYGAPEPLRHALAPLDGLPVTVVDNSSDPEVRRVCAALGARYLDPGRNLGFGAGVNLALADRTLPDGDVLLLNPDARIGAGEVERLWQALHAQPDLAGVAPRQADPDGREGRVAWPFPTPWRAWAQATGLSRLLPRGDGFVIGAVLLLRAEALRQVGRFDERFFLYAEETDWARRAALLGWRHVVVPSVTAEHAGAGTSTDPAQREARFHGAQERYYRKHHGPLGWQLARGAALSGALVRGLVLGGPRGEVARQRARTYAHGPLRAESAYDRDSTRLAGAVR